MILPLGLVLALAVLGSVKGVPLASFYTFGTAAGDAALPRNDDGYSSLITLSTTFHYFGTSPNAVYVRIN